MIRRLMPNSTLVCARFANQLRLFLDRTPTTRRQFTYTECLNHSTDRISLLAQRKEARLVWKLETGVSSKYTAIRTQFRTREVHWPPQILRIDPQKKISRGWIHVGIIVIMTFIDTVVILYQSC